MNYKANIKDKSPSPYLKAPRANNSNKLSKEAMISKSPPHPPGPPRPQNDKDTNC